VEDIGVVGGAVTSVCLAGGASLAVDAVIVAGSPRAAAALVPSSPALAAAAARAARPALAACLDLALTRLPSRASSSRSASTAPRTSRCTPPRPRWRPRAAR
jgi:protoporphyrinogen oxidase